MPRIPERFSYEYATDLLIRAGVSVVEADQIVRSMGIPAPRFRIGPETGF